MTKFYARALTVLTLLIGFGSCASAGILWTLNATFSDGLTATGTFTTTGGSSSTNPTFVSWNVTFAGGTLAHDFVDSSATSPQGAIFTQIPGFPGTNPAQLEELGFGNEPGFDPYVDFYLGSYLTDAGGTMALWGAFSCDGTCYGLAANPQVPNSLSAAAVPEPSAIILLGTFACILGTAFRRRKVS